jgi:hypothetical protein
MFRDRDADDVASRERVGLTWHVKRARFAEGCSYEFLSLSLSHSFFRISDADISRNIPQHIKSLYSSLSRNETPLRFKQGELDFLRATFTAVRVLQTSYPVVSVASRKSFGIIVSPIKRHRTSPTLLFSHERGIHKRHARYWNIWALRAFRFAIASVFA